MTEEHYEHGWPPDNETCFHVVEISAILLLCHFGTRLEIIRSTSINRLKAEM